ncbi:hypothetical protein UlMin_029236 [Ulmus minor]
MAAFKDSGQVIFILIYVDDMIVTGNNQVSLQVFVDKLHELFALKDLGFLHLFLGIEVVRDASGMYLTQSKYIEDLLEKTAMLNTKPCPMPAAVGKPLVALGGEPMKNQRLYKSIIGSLQYVTHTRPDLAFVINKLSQFLQSPTMIHWNAVKRVLRYLKGTRNMGLHIKHCDELNLSGYSDADWACSPDDKKSTAGYLVYFGDTLVSWCSKKQRVVSRSSTESEYRALAHISCEIAWLESLLGELTFSLTQTPVTWCDNLSASTLAANPVYHSRTKHVEIDIHFVRDKVLEKKLDVRYVPSHDQTADCLTKPLSHSHFKFLRDKLGVVERPLPLPSLTGDVRTLDEDLEKQRQCRS